MRLSHLVMYGVLIASANIGTVIGRRIATIRALRLFCASTSSQAFAFATMIRPKPYFRRNSFLLQSSQSKLVTTAGTNSKDDDDDRGEKSFRSPWSVGRSDSPTRETKGSRFRQHVNPLSHKFQIPTDLGEHWPDDGTFADPTLPLLVDVGCGKGGFLLEMALKRRKEEEDGKHKNVWQRQPTMNHLGLEIRPMVVQFAQKRMNEWRLSGTNLAFIGCNVNVDLERIFAKYTRHGGSVRLVSIQFPDPHFKAHHKKRRVVKPELVMTLAKFLTEGAEVFVQSDIKDVFDSMRLTIREQGIYFKDVVEEMTDFLPENPLDVPTEREISVLEQDLPVYRTIFRRTNVEFPST